MIESTLTPPKIYNVFSFKRAKIVGSSSTHQPFPIDQPTTPQALPLARHWRGNICSRQQGFRVCESIAARGTSAGYSHGTVSHVAPNIMVYKYTKKTAAPPTWVLADPVACWVASARPPAQKQQIPWPTAPQYRVHRRPMRSRVKTQINVASLSLSARGGVSHVEQDAPCK